MRKPARHHMGPRTNSFGWGQNGHICSFMEVATQTLADINRFILKPEYAKSPFSGTCEETLYFVFRTMQAWQSQKTDDQSFSQKN